MRKLLLVEWIDACSHSNWMHEDDVEGLRQSVTRSVGWKVKGPVGTIALMGMHVPQDRTCTCIQLIPKKWVKSVKCISEPKGE
jgi:hypothetical protein